MFHGTIPMQIWTAPVRVSELIKKNKKQEGGHGGESLGGVARGWGCIYTLFTYVKFSKNKT